MNSYRTGIVAVVFVLCDPPTELLLDGGEPQLLEVAVDLPLVLVVPAGPVSELYQGTCTEKRCSKHGGEDGCVLGFVIAEGEREREKVLS